MRILLSPWRWQRYTMMMFGRWKLRREEWVSIMFRWRKRPCWGMFERRRRELPSRRYDAVVWVLASLTSIFPLWWGSWRYRTAARYPSSSRRSQSLFTFAPCRIAIVIVQNGLNIMSHVGRHSWGVASEHQRGKHWTGPDARKGREGIWPNDEIMPTQTPAREREWSSK